MKDDVISVKGIKAYGHIGVYEQEKRDRQLFVVDFTLYKDSIEADDDLDNTIDYSKAAQLVKIYVEESGCDLIESVAYGAAEMLIRKYCGVKGVSVTVHKPCAPLNMEFEDVYVTSNLFWHDVCIGLGSNMGDKRGNIDYAVECFKQDDRFADITVSDYYDTRPYGYVEQDDFVNACVRASTYLTPRQLLNKCMQIEQEKGRKREIHWGPRILDVDILLYDSLVMCTPDLTLPHTDMCNRKFVLEPLTQIAGGLIHPTTGKSIRQLLSEVKE